ncbi:hypothetical protein EJ110_NYTH20762 [Nymphaea thermarum]|nr:hypothetical protein EJ110_NYTH20762 [Nymphaea thermarum]
MANKRTRGRHASTQMGNRHFSSEPIGRVAYICNMALYGLDLVRYDAPEAINVYVSKPDCYDLRYSQSDDEYGQHITFGVPGPPNADFTVQSRMLKAVDMRLSSKTLCYPLLVIILFNHALLSKGSRHMLEGGKYYRKEVPIKTITGDPNVYLPRPCLGTPSASPKVITGSNRWLPPLVFPATSTSRQHVFSSLDRNPTYDLLLRSGNMTAQEGILLTDISGFTKKNSYEVMNS